MPHAKLPAVAVLQLNIDFIYTELHLKVLGNTKLNLD